MLLLRCVQTVDVCRSLEDGLQMLDAFITFVVCDPCCTASYQHLRLSLMSTLCLKSIDNLPLIRYLLRLIPLMPVVHLCCYQCSANTCYVLNTVCCHSCYCHQQLVALTVAVKSSLQQVAASSCRCDCTM